MDKLRRENVRIIRSMDGIYHADQINYTLTALIDNIPVGAVEYSVSDNQPSLLFIQVTPTHQRQGLATLLMQELQSIYPDTEINAGLMTEAGACFYESLPMTEVGPANDRRLLIIHPETETPDLGVDSQDAIEQMVTPDLYSMVSAMS